MLEEAEACWLLKGSGSLHCHVGRQSEVFQGTEVVGKTVDADVAKLGPAVRDVACRGQEMRGKTGQGM